MRYRKLTSDGDYSFGHGTADFFIDVPEAPAQLVETRLGLWQGQWFLDQSEGTPYTTNVLGTGTKPLYDAAIQRRIADTQGVTGIENYTSSFDATTRKLTIDADVLTQYDPEPQPINVTI